MAKGNNMQWDAERERERKLFLAIIAVLAPSAGSVPWDKVNDMLGYENLTASGCQNKLKKIKEKMRNEFGDKAALAEGGDGDKSPAKDKKTTGGKKKRKADASDDDEEPKAKKVNGGIKAEAADDEDGLI
ncbi:hypothetical protein HII31_11635 [Pseudocercospora fuligena]|uniref:Uncharacterized protein n=1 Tax=Pseudocercospora fuligena TaxID=685502 RepID=A0A8H6RBK9_9PEZI|nr:hypothetical protein HII31_11635 [Pseudocercospora fuligena]